MLMGWVGLAGILLSFSAGRSSVGPNTVARLWRDILLMLSFSATLRTQDQSVSLKQTSGQQPGQNRSNLFRWSRRKRKVTRLGSGSDSSRFNMQLSLATLSDRAAQQNTTCH